MSLEDETAWEVFEFTGGLKEYVEWLNRDMKGMHKPLYVQRLVDNIVVEMALQW